MTLLIIADDQRMRTALKSFVRDLAASVYECSEGAETLATYARHRPDWVLIDAEMKDVEGFDVTRQLRAQDPQARILILTNYDDADLRTAAREAGACAYLVKDDLLALRRVLIAQVEEPR